MENLGYIVSAKRLHAFGKLADSVEDFLDAWYHNREHAEPGDIIPLIEKMRVAFSDLMDVVEEECPAGDITDSIKNIAKEAEKNASD
jgi:hypothetical protein